MARAVNCLSPVNGNPCGKCAACKAIADGSTDIIEIDAASNNGVDSIRQIRDEVIYSPIDCKYKVYIIDEVHMLSGAAFNALLKTLEEPPAHAVFILATTEYYKVFATILSRCQQFMFSKIDPAKSAGRLLEVAEKEGVKLDPAAAALIARLSDGAMRDALSLLDQCISFDSNVTEELVRKCSGAPDSGYLFGITEAAIAHRPADALKILDELISRSKDLSRFIEELTLHCRNLMLTKAAPESGLVFASDEEIGRYEKQCGFLSRDEIMRWAELVSESLDGISRMKQTGQARLLAESLLIRICTPQLNNDAASLAARLGALEKKIEDITFSRIVPQDEPSEPNEAPAAPAVEQPLPVQEEIVPEETEALQEIPEDADDGVYEDELPRGNADEEKEDEPPFDPPYRDIKDEDVTAFDNLHAPVAEEEQEEEVPPPPEPVEGQAFFEGMEALAPPKNESEETAEEAEIPQPIEETEEILPLGAQPLPQWSDIINSLSEAARGILSGTQAHLYDGKIYIKAPPSAKGFLQNGKRADALRDSAKAVMGGRFELLLLPDEKEEEQEDRITPLLDRAREMGIDVKVEDK